MVRSMTGFGKAACDFNGDTISIELSSVNHRFLDSSIRLPGEWSSLDPILRERIKRTLSRGKISVSISRKRNAGGTQVVRLNRDVAQQYIDASKELGDLLGAEETLSLQTLAQFDRIFGYEEAEEDLERAKDALLELLDTALKQLDAMRQTEGEVLRKDLIDRADALRASVATIESRLPALNEVYRERLFARIQDLNQEAGLNEDRVALEVAIMAEKGDVTEEIVRLKTHLDHAQELLDGDEPVGRRLNFLAQEVQREINTLGSKVRDTEVVREVLEMKSELERIREQIQNIE